MVFVRELPEAQQKRMLGQELPDFGAAPWATGPALASRRIALITTAGLHRRDDRPFGAGSAEYRVIPGATESADLVMSHGSTNFDRSGFQLDINTVFPIDRLRECRDDGVIGEIADFHYAFMGATHPELMAAAAADVAGLLKADKVDGVIFCPV